MSFVAFFTSIALLITSGLLVNGAIVAAHGAFRMLEDLFLDDVDAASGNSAPRCCYTSLGHPDEGFEAASNKIW